MLMQSWVQPKETKWQLFKDLSLGFQTFINCLNFSLKLFQRVENPLLHDRIMRYNKIESFLGMKNVYAIKTISDTNVYIFYSLGKLCPKRNSLFKNIFIIRLICMETYVLSSFLHGESYTKSLNRMIKLFSICSLLQYWLIVRKFLKKQSYFKGKYLWFY